VLVLERKPGEVILVGDNIKITVVDIRPGNKVRIGIDAPKDVSIDRLELRMRKEAGDGGSGRRWLPDD